MLLSINHVDFSYKKKVIFKDFNYDFLFGNDCIVVAGHNGAGKTTLLNLICGILKPNKGAITDLDKAYLPYDNNLYAHLTVLENIEFWYQIYNNQPLDFNDKLYNELLNSLELNALLDCSVVSLSTGEEKKVAFLITLLSHASLIVMDEPFNGIDPMSVVQITRVITKLRESGTNFLITSHQLDILEKIGTQYIIMKDYHIVEEGHMHNVDKSSLYKKYGQIYGESL